MTRDQLLQVAVVLGDRQWLDLRRCERPLCSASYVLLDECCLRRHGDGLGHAGTPIFTSAVVS